MLYVLKRGSINSKRCGFDTKFQQYKYAVSGRTVDGRHLEVIVSFNHDGRMEIITTYDLDDKIKF